MRLDIARLFKAAGCSREPLTIALLVGPFLLFASKIPVVIHFHINPYRFNHLVDAIAIFITF